MMTTREYTLKLALPLFLTCSSPLIRAAPPPPETLATVNVTAERIPQNYHETLASFEVLDRADIERSQAQSILELLRGLAGVDFSNQGGFGKPTSLYLRGTNPGHVMVMIDGIRVGSATLGALSWQYLPLSQIERVELVRGPRSHLYGSEAVGGVVHIFTRRGDEGLSVDAKAGYGSNSSYELGAGVSGGTDATRFSLRFARFETEGYDATVGNNPDSDGFENDSVSARLNHRFSDDNEFSMTLFRAEGNNEYDGYSPIDDYDADFVQQNVVGALKLQPSDAWRAEISIGESRDEEIDFVNGLDTSEFNTRRREIDWSNHFTLDDGGNLSLGLEFLRDQVESSSDYAETERDNTALFTRYGRTFGNNRISLGMRYDDNEAFGGETTGSIAWGYDLATDLTISASYGSAFKAPTFNDLYYVSPWGSNGNPDLDPERSETWELGLTGKTDWADWDLRLFRTNTENLIQWVESAPFIWRPENISEARIDGIELSASTTLHGWDIDGAITLIDPRDLKSDRLLPRRSRESISVNLNRRFAKTEIGMSWIAQSHRFDDPDNRVRLAGYGIVDLRLRYLPDDDWDVGVKLSNLFDKPYQTAAGYAMPGREVFVAVSYHPY